MEDISQVVHGVDRHPQMSQDTICGGHVKVKVRKRKLAQVRLAALKPEVPNLRLHDDLALGQLLALDLRRLGHRAQQLNRELDPILQLSKGGFFVREGRVLEFQNPHAEELGRVGHALDLVREAGIANLSAQGRGKAGWRGGFRYGLMSSLSRKVSNSSCLMPFSSAYFTLLSRIFDTDFKDLIIAGMDWS